MTGKSLRRTLPAMVLLAGIGPAIAQHVNTGKMPRDGREIEVPVRQGIASDGSDLHEHMEIQTVGMAGAASAASRPSRVVCERWSDVPAAQWRCRPHVQPR